MRFIDDESLKTLNDQKATMADLVSAYLPTDRIDSERNLIHFRNTLKSLRNRIPEIEKYEHYDSLLRHADDPGYWQSQSEGFCFFLSPNSLAEYKTPFTPPMFLEVGPGFVTSPLILHRFLEEPFYAVAFSLKKVRVFEANLFYIKETEIPGIDTDIFQRLQVDEIVVSLQQHSSGRRRVGSGIHQPARFHGQESGREKLKETLADNFVRSIGEAIRPHMPDRKRRVIFAGLDYLFPVFRDHIGLANPIVDQHVEGVFDEENPRKLHEHLTEIMNGILDRDVKEIDQTIEALRGTSRFEVRESRIAQEASRGKSTHSL